MTQHEDKRSERELMDEASLHAKLERMLTMTEANQEEISQIAKITHEQAISIEKQAQMIDKQSDMINKMWDEIQPILVNHRKKEELKTDITKRLATGGVYSICAGFVLLMWAGIKFYLDIGE